MTRIGKSGRELRPSLAMSRTSDFARHREPCAASPSSVKSAKSVVAALLGHAYRLVPGSARRTSAFVVGCALRCALYWNCWVTGNQAGWRPEGRALADGVKPRREFETARERLVIGARQRKPCDAPLPLVRSIQLSSIRARRRAKVTRPLGWCPGNSRGRCQSCRIAPWKVLVRVRSGVTTFPLKHPVGHVQDEAHPVLAGRHLVGSVSSTKFVNAAARLPPSNTTAPLVTLITRWSGWLAR